MFIILVIIFFLQFQNWVYWTEKTNGRCLKQLGPFISFQQTFLHNFSNNKNMKAHFSNVMYTNKY